MSQPLLRIASAMMRAIVPLGCSSIKPPDIALPFNNDYPVGNS
jgi:hypothetical protein